MQVQAVGGGEGSGTRLVRMCTHVSLLSLFNIGLHNCLLEETQVFNAFNNHMAKSTSSKFDLEKMCCKQEMKYNKVIEEFHLSRYCYE